MKKKAPNQMAINRKAVSKSNPTKRKNKGNQSIWSMLRTIPRPVVFGLWAFAFGAIGVKMLFFSSAATAPAVYLVPHQDDETISMAADIAAHVNAGRVVKVVLVTDGSASSARSVICQKTGYCLTTAQFSEARNKEFIAALAKLGVASSNIFFEKVPDGTVTSPTAEKIVDKYIALYPGASYKTMSWLDKHPDHYRLGYALNNRCVYRKITDCRFLQSPLYQKKSSIATAPVVTPRSGTYNLTAPVQAAVKEYRLWNPAVGRYAVGNYSVKSQLDYTYNTHYSLYHMNNSNWLSTSDASAAVTWVRANQQ